MKTKAFKVAAVSELDLMIAYESVDGELRYDDDLGTLEHWQRQMALILEEAEIQGTDEPIIILDVEESLWSND
ncbi:hypothetical protein VNN41_09915 [Lactococcus garvieae]|uniref:hypothetical protein n=1 Tax=Lactococcus garvieae TaxID=1363 RepID=UPI00324F72C5